MQHLVDQFKQELRQIFREELAANGICATPVQSIPELVKPASQKETCKFLGITEPTLISWRKKGRIPFMQVGSAIRYDLSAVLKAIEGKSKKGIRN